MRRDDDPMRPPRGERGSQAAELGGERDVRSEHLQVRLLDDGNVDRSRHEAALERGDDLLGDHHSRSVLRLGGRGREMWRDDDLLELEKLARVRLLAEDVEGCSGDMAGADGVGERSLVDQLATRSVDDPDARPHSGERCSVQKAMRLRGERKVQA